MRVALCSKLRSMVGNGGPGRPWIVTPRWAFDQFEAPSAAPSCAFLFAAKPANLHSDALHKHDEPPCAVGGLRDFVAECSSFALVVLWRCQHLARSLTSLATLMEWASARSPENARNRQTSTVELVMCSYVWVWMAVGTLFNHREQISLPKCVVNVQFRYHDKV